MGSEWCVSRCAYVLDKPSRWQGTNVSDDEDICVWSTAQPTSRQQPLQEMSGLEPFKPSAGHNTSLRQSKCSGLTRHASLPHPVLSLTETKMLLHFFQEADRQGQDGYAQCAVLLWWQCLAAWGKQIEQLRLLSSIPVGRRVHIRTHKEKDRQPLSVGMQQSTSSLGASWGTHTISSLQISHLINKCHPPAVTFLQTTYSMPFKILLYFT